MPMQRGLIAVLCLLATTPAEFAQTAPTTRGQISAYTVDGLALGERVQSNDAGYREYKCAPSDRFDGFTWCQKSRQQRERRRSFNITHSLLHSRDGRVVYVNRFQAPAFFGPKEADEDIQQYSHRLGESPRIIRMPGRAGVPDGILAVWGTVELKPLDSESIAALRKGSSSKNKYLIDLIGNVARSAKKGLPIYRVSGGAGFLWVASFGREGRGTLRLAAVDSSAFDPEPLPAEASTTGVSRQQAGASERTTADAQVAGITSAQRDAQVAQTEIERLRAERTQLNATIKRLEADKAAGEAKAYEMAATAYGTIIVLLVVLAGIGAFAFVARWRIGPASKVPSVTPETEEVPLSKPTDITKIELATAGDPQQFDLKAADSIALETNEPSLTEGADITKIELATTDDRQPIASYSEPETKEPSPSDEAIRAELGPGGEPLQPSSVASPSSRLAPVSASVRGLRALTGIMIVGTLSAGAIAAVLYLKAANPYQQASGIAESKDIPLEFHSGINKQTNKMEAFVVGWQENQNGVGAEIVGECANRNIIFKATVVGRDGTPDHLLWGVN